MIFVCALGRVACADDIVGRESIPAAASARAALVQAEAAIDAAREAGNVWLATPRRLAAARAAAEQGAFTQALAGAERARREATLALNQTRLERARYRLATDPEIDPAVRSAVRGLLAAYDGAAALRVLEQADGEP